MLNIFFDLEATGTKRRETMFEPMELTNDAVIKVIGVGGGGGNAVASRSKNMFIMISLLKH